MYSEIFKMELFMGVNFCSQESSSGPDSFLEPEIIWFAQISQKILHKPTWNCHETSTEQFLFLEKCVCFLTTLYVLHGLFYKVCR